MDLDIINKLYLELSQFATAKTAYELELEKENADLKVQIAALMQPVSQGVSLIKPRLMTHLDDESNLVHSVCGGAVMVFKEGRICSRCEAQDDGES